MATLNSEDTAIKKFENNPNKNRDSLYEDCPVPVGSPRDKNLDSEEYAMLSTGVYPPIFHSFRKKRNFSFI